MHRKFVRVLVPIQLWCMAVSTCAFAQASSGDTLQINVKQAETLFLHNNLTLIVQKYNIDNASA